MSVATSPAIALPAASRRSAGYWGGVGKRLRRDPVTLAFAALLLLILLAILFAPLLAPHDPYQTSMLRRLRPAGTAGLPARHRRAGARHADPAAVWRPAVLD